MEMRRGTDMAIRLLFSEIATRVVSVYWENTQIMYFQIRFPVQLPHA
jgi:hypothetical protein